MIQLYGQFHNYFSFANVSRALADQFRKANLPFMVWSTSPAQATYLNAPYEQGMSDWPIGVLVGYPTEYRWLQGHDVKVLVTVCESDKIPPHWVEICNSLDLIFVPSEFCRKAFSDSGVKTDIVVVPHGLHTAFLKKVKPWSEPGDSPSLLHISGSLSFNRRKGTGRLLEAYSQLVKSYPKSSLDLVVTPTEGLRKALEVLGLERNVTIHTFPNGLQPTLMAEFLRQYNLVVQPSRGEGFGIVPLEARAQGIPVAITNATGHAQHMQPEDYIIPCGPSEPLATQGNLVGSCPTVSVEAIYNTLMTAMQTLKSGTEETIAYASRYAGDWSWQNMLKPGILRLRSALRSVPKRRRLAGGIG